MTSLRRKASELRAKYDDMRTPSPMLARILDDPTQAMALYYAINRQVQLICTHSSRWEDGEVSIFDKTLIRMYEDGLPLQNIGLLELFLTEYMGLDLCSSIENEEVTATAFLNAAHTIAHNGQSTIKPFSRPPSQNCQDPDSDPTKGRNGKPLPEIKNDKQAKKSAIGMPDPKKEDDNESSVRKETLLENLVQVYQAAKADYYLGDSDKSGISSKKTDKFSNVRFLRDSSENLLRWMESEGYDDHPLMSEVKKVSQASCLHAEHLAGYKRSYEQRDDSVHARPYRSSYKRPCRRRDRGVDSYRPEN